jgi:uncharacterized protein (TIGR02466 family)
MIHNFFPVPVLVKQLSNNVIQQCIHNSKDHLQELTKTSTSSHLNNYSVEYSALDIPSNYSLLYKEICDATDEFITATGIDATKSNIKGWIQQYKTEHDHHPEHHHGVYGISGVFYMEANDKAGKIIFTNPNPMCKYQRRHFETDYTADYVTIQPVPGTLLLFPSWLMHEAEKGLVGVKKTILAFNLECKINESLQRESNNG